MAITLSYGYIQNQTGDRGSVFWPDLEFNIDRINGHDHNGVNSAALSSSSISNVLQSVTAVGWAAVAGQTGTYKQTIMAPAGINLQRHHPRLVDPVTGNVLLLSTDILTTDTFDVYSNDNTLTLEVAYL